MPGDAGRNPAACFFDDESGKAKLAFVKVKARPVAVFLLPQKNFYF